MMKVLCGAVLSALLLAAGRGRRLPVARPEQFKQAYAPRDGD